MNSTFISRQSLPLTWHAACRFDHRDRLRIGLAEALASRYYLLPWTQGVGLSTWLMTRTIWMHQASLYPWFLQRFLKSFSAATSALIIFLPAQLFLYLYVAPLALLQPPIALHPPSQCHPPIITFYFLFLNPGELDILGGTHLSLTSLTPKITC